LDKFNQVMSLIVGFDNDVHKSYNDGHNHDGNKHDNQLGEIYPNDVK